MKIFHLHWKAYEYNMIWSLVHTNLDVYKCQFESSLGWFCPSHRTSDQIPILIENLSYVIWNNVASKANECIHNRLSSQGQNFVSVVRKRSTVCMSKIWILPPILCRVTTTLTKQYMFDCLNWLARLFGGNHINNHWMFQDYNWFTRLTLEWSCHHDFGKIRDMDGFSVFLINHSSDILTHAFKHSPLVSFSQKQSWSVYRCFLKTKRFYGIFSFSFGWGIQKPWWWFCPHGRNQVEIFATGFLQKFGWVYYIVKVHLYKAIFSWLTSCCT